MVKTSKIWVNCSWEAFMLWKSAERRVFQNAWTEMQFFESTLMTDLNQIVIFKLYEFSMYKMIIHISLTYQFMMIWKRHICKKYSYMILLTSLNKFCFVSRAITLCVNQQTLLVMIRSENIPAKKAKEVIQ